MTQSYIATRERNLWDRRTAAQFVIPRYYNGVDYPSGNLFTGTYVSDGNTGAATPTTAIVATEDYDQDITLWQGGSQTNPGWQPALIWPEVHDVKIVGVNAPMQEKFITYYNPDVPYDHDGIVMKGSGMYVDNLYVYGIQGTGGRFVSPDETDDDRDGDAMEFDGRRSVFTKLNGINVLQGFDFDTPGAAIDMIYVAGFREYAVRISGGVQLTNLHTWGGQKIGLEVTGDYNHCTHLYPENSGTGMKISGDYNTFSKIYSLSNWTNCVVIEGDWNSILDFELPSGSSAGSILISGVGAKLINGAVNVTDTPDDPYEVPDVGIILDEGESHYIQGVTLGMYQRTKAIGMEARDTLNSCVIDIIVVGGDVGLDLNYGNINRLGVNNRIHVRHPSSAGQVPATPINLPTTSWHSSNEIYLNGTPQVSP